MMPKITVPMGMNAMTKASRKPIFWPKMRTQIVRKREMKRQGIRGRKLVGIWGDEMKKAIALLLIQ
jgi:hypothetical protein